MTRAHLCSDLQQGDRSQRCQQVTVSVLLTKPGSDTNRDAAEPERGEQDCRGRLPPQMVDVNRIIDPCRASVRG